MAMRARVASGTVSSAWRVKYSDARAMASSDGAAPAGSQRSHARKPARAAALAVSKNVTRSRRGRRLGQLGRQKMPVLVTP